MRPKIPILQLKIKTMASSSSSALNNITTGGGSGAQSNTVGFVGIGKNMFYFLAEHKDRIKNQRIYTL
jgi:hypothetical protein